MAYYAVARDGAVPAAAADTAGAASVARHRFQESHAAIKYTGRWRLVSGRAHAGGAIRVSTERNASASLTFTGRRITWNAPQGPSLGWARVFVDNVLVKRVTLNRSWNATRKTIFNRSWASSGQHTIRIEVIGTRGHPSVALDEFVVTD